MTRFLRLTGLIVLFGWSLSLPSPNTGRANAFESFAGAPEQRALDSVGQPCACFAETTRTSAKGAACKPDDRRILRVALFPYIPDAGEDLFQGLKGRIQREFECRKPCDLRLSLAINPVHDVYDLERSLPALLGPDGFDLVEIDTVLLPRLVERNLVTKFGAPPKEEKRFFPETLASVRVEGQSYGIPTWRCSNFLFTWSGQVARATNARALQAALEDIRGDRTGLVGDFKGSWTLPGLYLDAFVDTTGQSLPEKEKPFQKAIWDGLHPLLTSCSQGGRNPCLEGSYGSPQDSDAVLRDFVDGRALAFLGWSERLHRLQTLRRQRKDSRALYVASAALGTENHPLVWVDALVLNRQRATPQRRADALKFATYLNEVGTRQWIALSRDAPGASPRYLLPAINDFFEQDPIRSHAVYQALRRALGEKAIPPGSHFVAARDSLYKDLEENIETTPREN